LQVDARNKNSESGCPQNFYYYYGYIKHKQKICQKT
jgi:hypothetical protein